MADTAYLGAVDYVREVTFTGAWAQVLAKDDNRDRTVSIVSISGALRAFIGDAAPAGTTTSGAMIIKPQDNRIFKLKAGKTLYGLRTSTTNQTASLEVWNGAKTGE